MEHHENQHPLSLSQENPTKKENNVSEEQPSQLHTAPTSSSSNPGANIAAVPSHLLDPQQKTFIKTKHTSGSDLPLYFENILPQSSNAPQLLMLSLLAVSITQKLALNQQREPVSNIAPSCLLPTPIRPTNAVLLGDNRPRNQSVSFCDPDASEKSRRFTISAQPLSANLTSASRQGSFQGATSRKSSLTGEAHAGPTRSGSALAFQVVGRSDGPTNSPYMSSRVESPLLVEYPSLNHINNLDSRFSPSPPPTKANSSHGTPFKTSPVTNSGHATFSPDLPATLSGRSSRQGSDVGTQPISILRKNSLTKSSNKTLVASPVGPPVPFQQFLLKEDDKKVHILLACTGSVATIKVPLIIDRLFQVFGTSKISVQLVVTKCAGHFLKGLKIRKDVKIWRDEDEWANFSEWNLNATTTVSTCEPKKHKNPHEKMILHNELRKWADIMLLAPLSANTLAKIAHGISDNLLTSIIRSWGALLGVGGQPKKPIIVAPAMNTFMYTHPLTGKQLKILSLNEEGFGMEVLKPVEKVLVCGDIGMGGMREWLDIVETMRKKIKAIFAERQAIEGVPMSLDERDDEDGDEDEDDKNEDDDEDEDDDDEDEDDDEDDEDEDDDSRVTDRGDDEIFGPADDEFEDSASKKSLSQKVPTGQVKPVGMIDLEKRQDELKSKSKGRMMFDIPGDRNSEDVQRTMSPASEEARNIL